MKKKYGGLGLVDPETAKTSLLCKWIVKAIEPGESNFQLMLRYKLARFNAQRGSNWRISLDWFISRKNIKNLRGPKFGDILVKPGKLWLKDSTKFRHSL